MLQKIRPPSLFWDSQGKRGGDRAPGTKVGAFSISVRDKEGGEKITRSRREKPYSLSFEEVLNPYIASSGGFSEGISSVEKGEFLKCESTCKSSFSCAEKIHPALKTRPILRSELSPFFSLGRRGMRE